MRCIFLLEVKSTVGFRAAIHLTNYFVVVVYFNVYSKLLSERKVYFKLADVE